MNPDQGHRSIFNTRNVTVISLVLFVLGVAAFITGIYADPPGVTWQAFLINFLMFSGIAHGAVVFSAVMHLTKARWPGPLSGLSEAFAAFFPVSFVLFLLLFAGKAHIFPWQDMDLHGKEVWLNIPFLFLRDGAGLIILYLLGFLYLHYAMKLRLVIQGGAMDERGRGRIQQRLLIRMLNGEADQERIRQRASFAGALYITAFVLVQSLLGYDLVMSADPHWVSTLFGAYTFVKYVYIGLGALIVLAACYVVCERRAFGIHDAQFHDMGKLYFAFCLLWADFFYVQFIVIWYGNIPEETAYIIQRTITPPWSHLAWVIFGVCFIVPFLILLNKAIKTKPVFMMVLCLLVTAGIWLEHYLLIGPALSARGEAYTPGLNDVMMVAGFLGLMVFSVGGFLNLFPELVLPMTNDTNHSGGEK
jgi:hypothetical protein